MKTEETLEHFAVMDFDHLAEVTAEGNLYLEALDRIMEDYSLHIPIGVKMAIDKALTDECPKCRQQQPLYKVGNPYIRRFFDRLCQWCLIDEREHYD